MEYRERIKNVREDHDLTQAQEKTITFEKSNGNQ